MLTRKNFTLSIEMSADEWEAIKDLCPDSDTHDVIKNLIYYSILEAIGSTGELYVGVATSRRIAQEGSSDITYNDRRGRWYVIDTIEENTIKYGEGWPKHHAAEIARRMNLGETFLDAALDAINIDRLI